MDWHARARPACWQHGANIATLTPDPKHCEIGIDGTISVVQCPEIFGQSSIDCQQRFLRFGIPIACKIGIECKIVDELMPIE
jgi:hypothetical protein